MGNGEATEEPHAPEDVAVTPPAEAPDAPAPALARDWSHVRAFQTVEPAPDAGEDYPAELTKELDLRAARFARSVDDSIVLSSEGVMRWLGDPIARVVSGEALLTPRAILLADEALAGDARTQVETRVALWLDAHLKKLLGPLYALNEGAELAEGAKSIAAKLSESLGVLERERVRNEVRGLDQTARGALRKLGARFGSHYIYIPALLKPGPRGLCTLLWSLKRGSDVGSDRLHAFASAGRTSFPNEGTLSPDAYRVAGFRLCGERVVRIDIVERLSDLIRAAIPDHMRSAGRDASELNGFLVTPQMTSLAGCSGDAFASILRSLGFEPAKVSKAAFEASRPRASMEPIKPTVAPTPEAEASEAEAQPAEAEETATVETEAAVAETASEIEAPQEAASVEAPPELETPEAAAVEPEASQAQEIVADGSLDAEAMEAAPAQGDESPAEPVEEIEIWRLAPRRPRAPPRPPRAEGEARHNRSKPHFRRPEPTVATPAPVEAEAAPAEPRDEPPRREEHPRRYQGKPPRQDREERPREERRPANPPGPRRENRPKEIDPDSPFAKLAALKPLLERRDKRP